MDEPLRQAYLDALGITQYVARRAVPGAKVLPYWQLCASESLAVDENITAREGEATVHLEVEMAEAVLEDDVDSQSAIDSEQHISDQPVPKLDVAKLGIAADAHKPVSNASVKAKPQDAVRFSLVVLPLSSGKQFMFQTEAADAPGLSALEYPLVEDILRLCGETHWFDHHQPKLFRWPMVNNPLIALDSQAAKDALTGFLSGSVVAHTLFFGSILRDLYPIQAEQSCLNALGGDVWLAPGLRQLCNDWRLKVQAWQLMQAFLQA